MILMFIFSVVYFIPNVFILKLKSIGLTWNVDLTVHVHPLGFFFRISDPPVIFNNGLSFITRRKT